ncbi:hypothetical protein ACFLQV_03595, partial [Calditrichota bacterium]
MNLKKMLLTTLFTLLVTGSLLADTGSDYTSFSSTAKLENVQLLSSNDIGARIELKVDNLKHEQVTVNGVEYDRFQIDGARNAGPLGWPELPRMIQFMLIPPTSGVELNITEHESHIEGTSN